MEGLLVLFAGIVGAALGAGGALAWRRRLHSREVKAAEERYKAEAQARRLLEATLSRLSTGIETLPKLLAAIRAENEPRPIASRLTEAMTKFLPGYHALVIGLEPSGRLVGLSSQAMPDHVIRALIEGVPGPLTELAQQPKPALIDADQWRAIAGPELMKYLPGRVTAVPLHARGQPHGLMLLSNGRPEPVPAVHLALIEVFVGAAAAALAAHAARSDQAAKPAATPSAGPTPPERRRPTALPIARRA